jgi:hypothetical protein
MAPTVSPRAVANRQVADVLLGLAGLMQRLRMLPGGHPLIAASATMVERTLDTALTGRDHLVVEVGTVQLSVGGMETNPEFEPLRDLAIQLRECGVSTLELRPGVSSEELLALFGALAVASGPMDNWPITPGIGLRTTSPTAEPGVDPWLPLERLVLGEPDLTEAARDPDELAFALEVLSTDPERDARILEHLAEVARAAASSPTDRDLLARLLRAIPVATLRRLLAPKPGHPAQGMFLREAAGQVPAAVLLRLLEAAAQGREEQLSPAALHVLARLARRAETAEGSAARRALSLELTRLVPAAAAPEAPTTAPRLVPEPERVLKLALESGILESGTMLAADRMVARRQIAPLLALLETVPREDPIAQVLRSRVYHPQTVRSLVNASPVDLEALDRLIPATGIEAAPALLDGLAESRERRVRLRILDLLTRYGAAVAPLAIERIEGMPWYVQRNLLSLLNRLPDVPEEFSAEGLLHHRDPRVRHEAIALAINDPLLRDRGLAEALESSHEPTLRLGLTTLTERCEPEFVPRLIHLTAELNLEMELRVLAITALASVSDPVVLRVLRRLVVASGITALGRLAPKSEPMLAALRGLATHWHGHPKVLQLLETANESKDPEIRDAARPPARRSSGGFVLKARTP